jgi:phage tail sheath protein FI
MGFQVSPGVNVSEIDLTTIVPAVATTAAGMAGVFQWGPAEEITLVDSVNTLKRKFGGPDDENYQYFFTAANFLGYGNNLQVVRVVGSDSKNASTATPALIKNELNWESQSLTDNFYAKYPGPLGNALAVFAFDGSPTANGKVGVSIGFGLTVGSAISAGRTSITISSGPASLGVTLQQGDVLRLPSGQSVTVKEAVRGLTAAEITPSINSDLTEADSRGVSLENRYRALFSDFGPTTTDVEAFGGTNDILHIAVVDYTGAWTGTKGTVLETFEGLSKATDAKDGSGLNNFYRTIINEQSQYVWAGSNGIGFTPAVKQDATFTNLTTNATLSSANSYGITLGGGGETFSNAEASLYSGGYSQFEDDTEVDVSLILGGPASATISGLIVDLCDKRKDCIAFLSPTPQSDYINKDAGTATNNLLSYRQSSLNKNSSYAVLDSGYKYMYDNFNGVYRYVPLNGDIAGLLARTEVENEAWFSPAGFNRGQIRGVVKLAFNPRQSHRDDLYKNSVNPVVSFPGEGTILFGDKTMQTKPSAFDRINVRRLFIILEKAIATAAKFQLFEFNDEFTRSQFRNLIIPFLRDIQSRRGVQDFKVVCDESNNTGSVIDRNEFVADIFIKPNRSINFIQLNFIATASGVSFEEVGG